MTKPLTGYEKEIAILHAEARLDAELIEEFKGKAHEYKQAIERVREFLDDTIRDGIGRAPEDPRTYFRLIAHQVARVLEGEQ